MANVKVCDVCLHENKLTRTQRYLQIKKRPHLNLDLCETHMDSVTTEHPKIDVGYVKFVYKIKLDTEVTDEMAKGMLL